MEGSKKKIDIVLVNDRPFVYVAGLGKFINIAYDTPRYLKKKYLIMRRILLKHLRCSVGDVVQID